MNSELVHDQRYYFLSIIDDHNNTFVDYKILTKEGDLCDSIKLLSINNNDDQEKFTFPNVTLSQMKKIQSLLQFYVENDYKKECLKEKMKMEITRTNQYNSKAKTLEIILLSFLKPATILICEALIQICRELILETIQNEPTEKQQEYITKMKEIQSYQ
jgi:hypothetical protein